MAAAKAHAIAAHIWSDYCQGTFDRSLMAYQPLIGGKEVGLAHSQPDSCRGVSAWIRSEGLSDCTIADLIPHTASALGGNRHLAPTS